MMARPTVHGQRVSVGLRLPVKLHKQLTIAAERRDVSINLLATKAIERYLDKLPDISKL